MGHELRAELDELSLGDHCCLLFSTVEQQAELTAPFLGIGLERDERCMFIGDVSAVEAVRESLRDAGINVEQEAAKRRLILSSDQDHLDAGHWKTEKMLSVLQQAYDSALVERFAALRVAGDVAWQVGPHREFAELAYYEALLDMFFIGKRMVGMCQYSKAACPAETLSGILQAHRIAAIDSQVCSNYHYMPPDLLVEQDEKARQRKRVDWMTSQLLRIKEAEEERDALQDQLLHAQKLEVVGRLAGSVAHDFNNLLTGVIAFSRFALEGASLDEQTRGDIKEIELAGERGAALTRQLLAFARRHVRQPGALRLNDAIVAMERLLSRILGEHITLTTALEPELGNLELDSGQFEQVLMNLAVNARDAMPDGGNVTLTTTNLDLFEKDTGLFPGASAGSYVLLSVSDTGCGMDARTQARMFEPFFTTKDASQGTGLGLSTIHDIVKQNGGMIAVESSPGKGTVFRIIFPRLEPSAAVPAHDAGATAEAIPLEGTETVLVLDHDDTVRQLMERMLVHRGYTVLTAKRPADAVTLCATHVDSLHLLITDALLPWRSGRQALRDVQRLRPNMKVLFVPGYPDRDIVEPDLLQSGQAILDKPFRPDSLLRKVRLLLDET